MRRMNPPDQIHLTGLQLRCHIGVPDEERAAEQLLHADLVLHLRARFEDMADELSYTIDYAAVATRLEQVAAAKPRRLIETLAAELAQVVLEEFAAAQVEITLRKRILPQTDHVAVRLVRTANNAR